MNYLINH